MKEKILNELRKLKFATGYIWKFQQYHNIFRDSLNPKEKREFDSCMKELCENGFFIKENDGSVPVYRLTELGEKELYD